MSQRNGHGFAGTFDYGLLPSSSAFLRAGLFVQSNSPRENMPHCVVRLFAATFATVFVGACSLGTIGGILSPDSPSSENTPTVTPASATQPDMAGRWVLATGGVGSCGMTFTGPPGGKDGTVAPEGGCPGRFFTSRSWSYEQNSVVIRSHAGELLAQLRVAAVDRLTGQGANGEPVTLSR